MSFFSFFQCSAAPRNLHSFPTRRSSDLYVFRRTLLGRALQPELDRLLTSDNGESSPGSARNRLLDHIEANLLYYSTAIISAGDPAARHAALAKLLDPSGRPLTDVVENTVLGRVG